MTKTFNDGLIELLKRDLRFVDEQSKVSVKNEIVNEA